MSRSLCKVNVGFLPIDTDVKADLSLGTRCGGDTSKCRCLKAEVEAGLSDRRNGEVRMVEHIEHYHPELDVASLGEIGPLSKTEVRLGEVRTKD